MVVKAGLYKGTMLFIAALVMALLLSACDTSGEVKTTQTPVVQKTSTLTPDLKSMQTPTEQFAPSPTPSSCNRVYDPYFPTLEESIGLSNQIFLGKVVKFDPYIWNTSDGKAPANLCIYDFDSSIDPFIPVHIQVLENLKGNLATNSEVILLIRHENIARPPLFLPAINIKPDEEYVWFLGGIKNYRKSNPANPLSYPEIYARYKKYNNVWDGYLARGDFASIDELKSLIMKASITPTVTTK